MKSTKQWLSLLLAAALLCALCACGGKAAPAASEPEAPSADTAAYAGEYTYFCCLLGAAYLAEAFDLEEQSGDIPEQYVLLPDMEDNTVTLDADGTGYLYWGDDNQGPIDWWTMDADALRFQAGVSVFDGTIEDGFMTVEIGEGLSLCLTAPGTDTSGIKPLSLDEYFDLLLAPEAEEAAAEPEETSEPEETPEPEPAQEASAAGEYAIFAVENDGYLVYADAMEISSTLTLAGDGTGRMTMDDDAMDIVSWTDEDGTISVTLADESSALGTRRGGVIELDILGDGSLIFVYALDGADTSAYAPMTRDELLAAYAADTPDSRLYALWESLEAQDGVHLRYDLHTEYMDADQSFDVHARGGTYYSMRTTHVAGFEDTTVTFFRDGTAYNLDPASMTGVIVTTTTSSAVTENAVAMDTLYSNIMRCAQERDYTSEPRTLDGTACEVEIFPAAEYTPEIVFWFDDAGRLIRCEEKSDALGETVYTVHAVDDAVDETLFDISGYDITSD